MLLKKFQQKLHNGFLKDRNHRLWYHMSDWLDTSSFSCRQDHRLHRRNRPLIIKLTYTDKAKKFQAAAGEASVTSATFNGSWAIVPGDKILFNLIGE